MSLLHAVRHRLAVLVRGAAYDRELADEMHFHLALDAEHDERIGLSASAARAAAGPAPPPAAPPPRSGTVPSRGEEPRPQTSLSVVDDVGQDLRYALRAF